MSSIEMVVKLGRDTSWEPAETVDVKVTEENLHLVKLEVAGQVLYLWRSDLRKLAHVFGDGPYPITINVRAEADRLDIGNPWTEA